MINKILLMEFFKDDDIKVVDKDFYIKSQMKSDVIKYITILEEENQRLKELCDKYEEEHNNEFKIWKDERHQLLDYKSRCEKANQYIKKNTHEYKMFNEELGHFSNLTNISIDKNNKVFINDLLKILGDEE